MRTTKFTPRGSIEEMESFVELLEDNGYTVKTAEESVPDGVDDRVIIEKND